MTKATFKGSLMFPSQYVAAEDLKGKDAAVTIDRVEIAHLQVQGGAKEKKFLLHFANATKPLVLNKTNANMIASIHCSAAEKWKGKRITLYPTTCQSFGQTTSCIRVRDRAPDDSRKPAEGLPTDGDGNADDGTPQVDHRCPDCGRTEVAAIGSKPQCSCGATMEEA